MTNGHTMTDEERIVARILDVIPPRSFELSTFFSLFRVRFTDEIETACVTCGDAPELLLNKTFIDAHCRTAEHLFMLVMHELYHVILGHTKLFPRSTPVRNIVFDAVINAILCSLFPAREFTSFFTDYYRSDTMPSALLRPKGEGTPRAAEEALHLLYDKNGTGTYCDVFEVLARSLVAVVVLPGGGGGGRDGGACGEGEDGSGTCPAAGGDGDDGDEGKETDGSGKAPSADDAGDEEEGEKTSAANDTGDEAKKSPNDKRPVLLGSHGSESGEVSPELRDLLHEIISKWPSPDRPLAGRDLGSGERVREFSGGTLPGEALRRGVRRLMRRATLPGPTERRRMSMREIQMETSTFLPVWTDRSHEARTLALGDALLYKGQTSWRRPVLRDMLHTCVFLDVSGSVAAEVPVLARVLEPYCRRGLCEVNVFSTTAHPVTLRDLIAKKFPSTGGTEIDCVLKAVLERPRARRPQSVVILTDGFTGRPNATLASRFLASGIHLHVGLVGKDADADDLSSLAASVVSLTD